MARKPKRDDEDRWAVIEDALMASGVPEMGYEGRELMDYARMQRNDNGEAKRKFAHALLYDLYYRGWVKDEADNVVRAIRDGEVLDEEGLRQCLDEQTDSRLIYTADQQLVLFVSESVDEGASEMEDMGGGGDNPTAVLAVLTYRIDVSDALRRRGIDYDFDRDAWLEANPEGQDE